MRYESFVQQNTLTLIEPLLSRYEKTEEYAISEDVLYKLYKSEAFRYPVFINNLKNMVKEGFLSEDDGFKIASIYFMTKNNGIELENFRKTIELYDKEKEFTIFDIREIENIRIPQVVKEYLFWIIEKISVQQRVTDTLP